MNWKLIFQLSIFGLIMAFGTVSLIRQDVEVAFWLFIFAFCGYVIAKVCTGNYFLHGFITGLYNCIWITIVHLIYYKKYVDSHPKFEEFTANMPAVLATHPRVSFAIAGLAVGILSAVIFGFFAFVIEKFMKINRS